MCFGPRPPRGHVGAASGVVVSLPHRETHSRAMPDLDDFLRMLRKVATTSVCLSQKDEADALKLAHVLAKESRSKFAEFLGQEHRGDIALVAYMSDGWGATIRSSQTCRIREHRVTRRGQFRHEFGLQRAFAKALSPTGEPQMAMMFSEPIAMRHGRTAWHFFTLACDFMGTPRSYGHADISLTVYIFDGGMKDPLSTYLMARHDFAYEGAGEADADTARLQHSDLVFSARCASHVASCAVNHGLDIARVVPDTNKIAHIVIASVRQGVSALHEFVPEFVFRHVQFCAEPSGPAEQIAQFWRALGVEESVVDEFVQLDPRWQGDALLVSASVEGDPASLCRIAGLMMYALHFEDYVSTRWCGVGNAMRLYLRARAMGLSGLVAMCKEHKVCQFHLAGHEQLVPHIAGFMVVAALGAYPAEAFLKEVLADDRILRRLCEFRAALEEETVYISSLPVYVWSRLAAMADGSYDASELRDLTAQCAMISGAYIERETLAPLEQEPFRFSQGDTHARLQELINSEPSSDPTTRKVQFLLQSGLAPIARVARAFTLLREMPFSVHMVEQAHGLGACLMKYHERYGESLLRARGSICQQKPLFVADPDDRHEMSLRQRLASLQRKVGATPGRGSGVRAFVSHFSKTAEGKALAASQGRGGQAMLARAAQLYAQMSGAEHARWDAREAQRARLAKELASEEAEELQQRIWICERRKKLELEANGLPNQVRSCRYPRERQQSIADEFEALGQHTSFETTLRKREFAAPCAPTPEEQDFILDRAQPFTTPPDILPWFAPHICRNRDRFHGVALACGSPDALVVYLFLYAHKRPFQAMFLELRRRPRTLPVPHRQAIGSMEPSGLKAYDYMPAKYVSAHLLPIDKDEDLFVLPGFAFHADTAICASLGVAYEEFIWHHPLTQKMAAPERKRKRPAKVLDSAKVELMKEFGFLRPEDFQARPASKQERKPRRSNRPAPGPASLEPAEPDEESSEGMGADAARDSEDSADVEAEEEDVDATEELAALRAEWDFESGWEMGFYTRILGGSWTKKNKGIVADGVLATSRAWTRNWRKAFGWPNSRTFFFSKFTREGAHRLSEEWCKRADHYYRLFVEDEPEDGAKFRYTKEHMDSYEEDLDWITWLCEQDENGVVWAAAQEIRNMRPAAYPGAWKLQKA